MTGLTGNFVAIPILLSKRLSSIFNRILICLAVFDNVFIGCSLLEAIRYPPEMCIMYFRIPEMCLTYFRIPEMCMTYCRIPEMCTTYFRMPEMCITVSDSYILEKLKTETLFST
jgi:hypothetical protein